MITQKQTFWGENFIFVIIFIRYYMKIIFLFFLCIGVWTVQAGSLVEGVIYLKDGRSVEFKGRDRIEIPSRHRDVKGMRDAFTKNKQKEIGSE